MELLKVGVHSAKIYNYGIITTRAGKPNAVIDLEISGQILRKHFGLDEGSGLEFFAKVLVDLGYGSSKLDSFSEGKGLTTGEIFAVIEHQEYEGKTRAAIKFINSTNTSGLSEVMSKAKALLAVKNVNIGSKLAQFLQAKEAKIAKPEFNEQDIPF